ncbi:MAG: glycoside hydrolase family 5 protein [Treponema sp.]|jgi:endoglucanase|nr:glycoside hydrolase family 5 protein [Treponema sp.]
MKTLYAAWECLAVSVLVIAACSSASNIMSVPVDPKPFNNMSAVELVADIRAGWNLGNTLDCSGINWLGPSPAVYSMETAWGNPITSKANIDALKKAGFNAIRIPVSWTKAADPKHNIRPDWMARVKDVVDYAAANDMYIILNTHHDEDVFRFFNNEAVEGKKAFKRIWEQIAGTFKNYDEKLIFEALNEPRTPKSSNEWNGGTAEERDNLNAYYQIFVDAVRKSGSNNSKRLLLINPYGASSSQTAMNALKIPNDRAENRIIVSYHAYEPYNFALDKNPAFNTWTRSNPGSTQAITNPVDRAYDLFVSKGIPVLIGEFGAMNKNNLAARTEWVEFYASYARGKGIPCFWWDNGAVSGSGENFGLLNRKTNTFTFPEIVDAFMRGAGYKKEAD